jgi:hypothetical protein
MRRMHKNKFVKAMCDKNIGELMNSLDLALLLSALIIL